MSVSPLPVGLVANQLAISAAPRLRLPLERPWPSPASASPTPPALLPLDLRWAIAVVRNSAVGSPDAKRSKLAASTGRCTRVDPWLKLPLCRLATLLPGASRTRSLR